MFKKLHNRSLGVYERCDEYKRGAKGMDRSKLHSIAFASTLILEILIQQNKTSLNNNKIASIRRLKEKHNIYLLLSKQQSDFAFSSLVAQPSVVLRLARHCPC